LAVQVDTAAAALGYDPANGILLAFLVTCSPTLSEVGLTERDLIDALGLP
jgi:hypothetical protein